jgi:hypothetical protein
VWRQPADVEYEDALDDAAQEWRRMRIWLAGGQVVRFTVQYETTIAGARVPVVRYDTAHGFAHRDRLDRRGRTIAKDELGRGLALADALTLADRDLRQNWRRYRRDFVQDEP